MTGWVDNFSELTRLADGTIYLSVIHQKIKDKPSLRQVLVIANGMDDDGHTIGYCDFLGKYSIEDHERASAFEMEGTLRIERMKKLLKTLGIRHTIGIISQSPYAGTPFNTSITESAMDLMLQNQIKKILQK
jgi:hypothetical protein